MTKYFESGVFTCFINFSNFFLLKHRPSKKLFFMKYVLEYEHLTGLSVSNPSFVFPIWLY